MQGFDSSGEEDFLGRKRLARQVFELILNTPPDWSVRVGIYGAWGSGKTTVLDYIFDYARAEGHPVITLDSWNIASLDELKKDLKFKLIEHPQIEKYITSFSQRAKKELKSTAKKFSRRDTAKALDQASKTKTLSEGVFKVIGLAGGFLTISEEEITAIIEGLKKDKKRIIIAFDDLDRANPKLIPSILLSIREFIDYPGFSFILPFDNNIVAKALLEDHPAYGTGHEFLEKIIDFPYFLSLPTTEQRKALFQKHLSTLCPFIPAEQLVACYQHLPPNPRKIKALVRSLKTLEPEIHRHKEGEINWASLLFVAIIKQISPQFLAAFHQQGIIGEQTPSLEFEIAEHTEKASWDWFFSNQKGQKEKQEKQLTSILSSTNDIEPSEYSHIKKLVYSWIRNIGIYTLPALDYTINLLDRPPIITWSEYDNIFATWLNDKNISAISSWIMDHAKERYCPINDIADDFFLVLIERRKDLLESASNVLTSTEHEDTMQKAADCLELIDLLFKKTLPSFEDFFISERYLRNYLEMIGRWSHFDENPADKSARQNEATVLKDCVSSITGDIENIASLLSEFKRGNSQFADKKDTAALALINECFEILSPNIIKSVLSLFEIKDEIIKIRSNEYKGEAVKVFLNPDSKIYKSPFRENFLEVLDKAKANLIIHKNCYEFFSLLARKAVPKKPDQRSVFDDNDFIKALWLAVISNEFQFRSRKELYEERTILTQKGVSEELLPMPQWLKDVVPAAPSTK